MKKPEEKTILIIGSTGGLAQILIEKLLKIKNISIIGVDERDNNNFFDERFRFIRMKYTRGLFENLFRDIRIDEVIHLARLGHTTSSTADLLKRLDLNIMGTKRILDLSLKFKIKKILVLSTYHVYGAFNDNSTFLTEDAPLRASFNYPELRDVVEMDQMVTNWMWKNQKNISTICLRPCSIVGPRVNNTMTKYLRSSIAPITFDFNPMFQFIFEEDMANIIVNSLTSLRTGVYNVAPDEFISLKKMKLSINNEIPQVPSFILKFSAKILSSKFWKFPLYLLEYIKYPSIIDGSLIEKTLKHQIYTTSIKDIIKILKK